MISTFVYFKSVLWKLSYIGTSLFCGSLNSSSPKDVWQAVWPLFCRVPQGVPCFLIQSTPALIHNRDPTHLSHQTGPQYPVPAPKAASHTQFQLTQPWPLWPFIKAPFHCLIPFPAHSPKHSSTSLAKAQDELRFLGRRALQGTTADSEHCCSQPAKCCC